MKLVKEGHTKKESTYDQDSGRLIEYNGVGNIVHIPPKITSTFYYTRYLGQPSLILFLSTHQSLMYQLLSPHILVFLVTGTISPRVRVGKLGRDAIILRRWCHKQKCTGMDYYSLSDGKSPRKSAIPSLEGTSGRFAGAGIGDPVAALDSE